MLPRDKVIWSRECTSTMAVAAVPPHDKVRNKTARIRVLLVVRRTLMCHSPIFFVISLINPRFFTNLTVLRDISRADDVFQTFSFSTSSS